MKMACRIRRRSSRSRYVKNIWIPFGKTTQPAGPAPPPKPPKPPEPPQACMACRKDDDRDPVGRGRGLAVELPPPPPPGKWPPAGGVIPCCSRHLRKAELCDAGDPELELEPDDPDELAPHPATASTAISAAAPKTADLPARRALPGSPWDRRINYCLLTAQGRRLARRTSPHGSQGGWPCDLVVVG
jgi:hypothetical protein